jgi:hypothetical protein
MQGKAPEPTNLDSLSVREGFAHELENMLDRQLDILGRQVFLRPRDRFNEF